MDIADHSVGREASGCIMIMVVVVLARSPSDIRTLAEGEISGSKARYGALYRSMTNGKSGEAAFQTACIKNIKAPHLAVRGFDWTGDGGMFRQSLRRLRRQALSLSLPASFAVFLAAGAFFGAASAEVSGAISAANSSSLMVFASSRAAST